MANATESYEDIVRRVRREESRTRFVVTEQITYVVHAKDEDDARRIVEEESHDARSEYTVNDRSYEGPEEADPVWWIIIGRRVGDDEDVAHKFHVATEEEAFQSFKAKIAEEDGGHSGDEDDPDYEDSNDAIYVTTVVSCGTHEPEVR